MRILVCNERFLFRFGVDRCLLMLGNQWRKDGHEIIMMGNRMDPASVSKCSDRFIRIPDAPDYRTWNEYTLDYLRDHWDEWFDESNRRWWRAGLFTCAFRSCGKSADAWSRMTTGRFP